MFQAWYEQRRDEKDHIYFARHEVKNEWFGSKPYPGFHNSIEFAFGLQGGVRIVINGEEHLLHEGEVCFMNSLEPHKFYYQKGVAVYIVLISQSFFTEVNRLGSISFPTHMAKIEHFETVKRYLDYTIENWDPESLLCKRAFADTLSYLMTKYYRFYPKEAVERHPGMLLNVLKYIGEHYAERLTVDAVAKKFGYSANYFSTIFNELMGTSFPDYLNTCRIIEYNRIRREMPELSACRAAELCGFGSMNTFYRAWNKFSLVSNIAEQPFPG
ncbi:MAG: helix-turn-helix transcriptional regulator [Clostridia bacterium]|nr:helix-turn-helix transcriptional regulator [Clostridia bacterium]